jgi:hypothetical protein
MTDSNQAFKALKYNVYSYCTALVSDHLKTLLTLNSLSRRGNRKIVAQIMALWPFFRK